jgi:hypothetical protein
MSILALLYSLHFMTVVNPLHFNYDGLCCPKYVEYTYEYNHKFSTEYTILFRPMEGHVYVWSYQNVVRNPSREEIGRNTL